MYAHGVLVEGGQVVEAGTQIGEIGNDGSSSGPHLHFAMFHTDGDPLWPPSTGFHNPEEFFADQGVAL